MDSGWQEWASRLEDIAAQGIESDPNPFDLERYLALGQIAAGMRDRRRPFPAGSLRGLFDQEPAPSAPKIAVRGVVFRDDSMLFVRERIDDRWSLPGGWAEVDEPPSLNAEREIYEESGYQTRAVKLLAVYDRSQYALPPTPYHIYLLYFLCELTGGTATPSIETSQVEFFREDQIPDLPLGRVTAGQVARMFEHHRHPEWPADFD